MKPIFNEEELAFSQAVSRLAYCNPFLPERIAFEREALGGDFDEGDASWNVRGGYYEDRPNLNKIITILDDRLPSIRLRIVMGVKGGAKGSAKEIGLYEEMVLFLLYHRYHERFQGSIEKGGEGKIDYYADFKADVRHFLDIKGISFSEGLETPHLFACFFQVRRAFYHIFNYIIGSSGAITKLRASVWQSIFTHDLKRYQRGLYSIMGDMTTLITGPSGTGKELVARAIGLSRYIPFDERTGRFTEDFTTLFLPLNISALSPTLIESELFGHKKGAFTGALQDRTGWLETCSPAGSVFLDEIGEVDPAIQVKLLRVLQERTFQRLGDTDTRLFKGKIIAATNCDLAEEMEKGNFRRDFYYRLCSDIITTPSLQEQLRESQEELDNLIFFLINRNIKHDAKALTKEVVAWIKKELGPHYSWPGNIRELEQCIRNVMIRNEYRPPAAKNTSDPEKILAEEIRSGSLTADELLKKYCRLVYSQTGSYQETARRLELDRRTVKAKVGNG